MRFTPRVRRTEGACPAPQTSLAATIVIVATSLLLLPATALGANWKQQDSGTTNVLPDIDFVDAQHGWAVGTGGTIAATTDGGAHWKAQAGGTTQTLEDVDFVSASTGWAVGQGGTILRTTDGGATWSGQTSGVTAFLYGVSFVNASQGWASGQNGAILTTTNGGATWSKSSPFGPSTYNTSWRSAAFTDVSSPTATHVWAALNTGKVYFTTDGGATWQVQESGASHLDAICFPDTQHGWAVNGSTIYAYGGSTPSAKPLPKALANVTVKKGTYTWSVIATADGVKSAKASSKKLTVK